MNNHPYSTRTLSIFLLVFVACSSFFGQTNRSTISGFVFDPDRHPVSSVVVELRNEFSTISRMKTEGSGRFYFTGLANGRYTIRVLPLGTPFLEQSEDVELVGTGVSGQTVADNVQKDIYLKSRKGADAVPFKNEVVYAQDVPRDAEALYKSAVADLDSKRVQSGVASLEKALELFPTYFLALQKLGVVQLIQERFEDAAQSFKRAIAVNERCFDCWYGLAYANYSVRKFADATTAAERAVNEKPDSMEANLLLGMGQRMTKNLEKAEQSLLRASKIANGESPDVHWNLALLYGKDMNKFAEAAKELEAYLKTVPNVSNKEEILKLIKQFKDKAKSAI